MNDLTKNSENLVKLGLTGGVAYAMFQLGKKLLGVRDNPDMERMTLAKLMEDWSPPIPVRLTNYYMPKKGVFKGWSWENDNKYKGKKTVLTLVANFDNDIREAYVNDKNELVLDAGDDVIITDWEKYMNYWNYDGYKSVNPEFEYFAIYEYMGDGEFHPVEDRAYLSKSEAEKELKKMK